MMPGDVVFFYIFFGAQLFKSRLMTISSHGTSTEKWKHFSTLFLSFVPNGLGAAVTNHLMASEEHVESKPGQQVASESPATTVKHCFEQSLFQPQLFGPSF